MNSSVESITKRKKRDIDILFPEQNSSDNN